MVQAIAVILSFRAAADAVPSADPANAFWRDIPAIVAENDQRGRAVPGHRTEIRSRWTPNFLYFLFVCPYEQLHLKTDPRRSEETNRLWEWDVAEVFLGSNYENIRRYKEFEISPQGEWVDLDIDRDSTRPEDGWTWQSGFELKSRIDSERRTWYGEMKIPIASVDSRPAIAGREMRVNFYRAQGPPPRKLIAWRPTNASTFHVPEAFGTLRLVERSR